MEAIESTPWPIRPCLHKDEGVAGYLLRIAYEYDWSGIPALCADLLGRRPSSPHIKSGRLEDAISEILARIMQMPPKALTGQWGRLRGKYNVFDSSRIITDVEIGSPRVCAACVAANRYLRFGWQVGHVLICPDHAQCLIGCCLRCGEALTWHAALLDGCPACHTSWRLLSQESIPAPGSWPSPKKVELHSLYRAFLAAAAPGAPHPWPRQCIPYDAHKHRMLMQTAYAVVYSKTGNEALLHAGEDGLAGLGPLKDVTREHLAGQVRALYRQERAGVVKQNITVTEHHCLEIALPKRIRHAPESGADAWLTASASVCATLLGVSNTVLNDLVEAAIVPQLSPPM